MNASTLAMVLTALASGALLLAAWRFRPGNDGLTPGTAAARVRYCWWLWLCFLLTGVLVSACVASLDGRPEDSTIRYALRLLVPRANTDSWALMLMAIGRLQEQPDSLLYQALFFDEHRKFQYPLTSLVWVDLPKRFLHADPASVIAALQGFSRLCVIGIGAVFAALLTNASLGTSPGAASGISRTRMLLLALVGVASAMLFYPIARSETLGQIQTAMTLAAGLALLAWQRGQPRLAGFWIGLCCVIKPHWIVVVIWGLLRRQWGFALSASAVAGVTAAVAVAMYGLANLLDYIPVVAYIGRHGESFFANQSINGLVNRLLFNGDNLIWRDDAFAPFHPVVHAATLGTSILILGISLFWQRSRQPGVLDLGLIMLALTIASPIAWEHHYGVLLPIFALMLPAAMERRPWGRLTLPGLLAAFLLVSQSFSYATGLLAHTRWNFVQSHVLAGGLIGLALLFALTRTPRAVQGAGTVESAALRA